MGGPEILLWIMLALIAALIIHSIMEGLVEIQKAKNPCIKEHAPETRDHHGTA